MRGLAVGLLAAALLGGAAAAVGARSLVRAAFGLAAALLATAGLYLAVAAPLLTAVQILLYTGGVLTLVAFAIVVTGGEGEGARFRKPAPAAVVSLSVFAVLASAALRVPETPPRGGLDAGEAIGTALFRDYLVPFELLSVLLLAAVVGALLIARKDRPA